MLLVVKKNNGGRNVLVAKTWGAKMYRLRNDP